MRYFWIPLALGAMTVTTAPAQAGELFLAYPPVNHQTTAERIFFIGSAPAETPVTLNGNPIQRSRTGNFAPVVPLRLGENVFTFRAGAQEIQRVVIRNPAGPALPPPLGFAPDSLWPNQNIARLPRERICFRAVAPQGAQVWAEVGTTEIPLQPQGPSLQLPPNSALLTGQNQPQVSAARTYSACQSFETIGNLGQPRFRLQVGRQIHRETAPGLIQILDPDRLEVVEVIANPGVARTGPSTDHSRLTPLPQGTRAAVNGAEGEWLRLDYGGWINRKEMFPRVGQAPEPAVIRSIGYRRLADQSEIRFPLASPVPISIEQSAEQLTLILHNVSAQTDTIRLDNDPVIQRFVWLPGASSQARYGFSFKTPQQWGYTVRYEGSTLVLSLRYPPRLTSEKLPLQGTSILLDPGHGGSESGALGPTGYPEKAVNLLIAQKLAPLLEAKGAKVHLTRTADVEVSLAERIRQIDALQPTLALSIHYNALPDSGDPNRAKGISTFWFQPQAEALARYLQADLTQRLNRSSDGVYWNNLALTRPHSAPAVLLELGFMINPEEFEWITDPQAQDKLVAALAESLTVWLQRSTELNTPAESAGGGG
ncbi:MAG: N-acetylmuramoyl-L-alanine amidase [Cyanobacteriota bacterium]